MNARISDAHPVPPTHDRDPSSSRPNAEAAAPAAKAYVKPVLEEHGSLPEVTAGSNIFGDDLTAGPDVSGG